MQKEILIAIDGSAYSNHSLSYLSTLFAQQEDINFHLCMWLTSSVSVIPSVADSDNSLIPTNFNGQEKKEATAKRYLNKASDLLTQKGIAPERIQTSVQISGYNIAASIQQRGDKQLADSILVGRRGLGGISEMLMGSVSATLFRKCRSTPLWIIDGEVNSKNILVPVDGSPFTLAAVDHLCHILNNRKDVTILLLHCSSLFAKTLQCDLELFHPQWDKEWCNTHLSNTDCLHNGPRQLLLEAGIPDRQIKILPNTSDLEKAHGIIREAKKHNCGTIVMGRRGVGMAKGLFGGVSDRTVKRVQDMALWIVG